jgi:hypothetical protein
VVRAYQDTCARVIARFEGHIAQYLGDGLLVYFGYPLAHEDDAQRAVRAGLGIVEAMGQLNTRLKQEGLRPAPTQSCQQLALGETPNLAAFDRGRGKLTVWLSTQIPHLVRTFLAQALNMPEHRLQVIAPEVGGGFGAKGQLYPEEILIPYLARALGRPVKWIECRREHFTSTIHGRGLVEYFDAAVQNDGSLLMVTGDAL